MLIFLFGISFCFNVIFIFLIVFYYKIKSKKTKTFNNINNELEDWLKDSDNIQEKFNKLLKF